MGVRSGPVLASSSSSATRFLPRAFVANDPFVVRVLVEPAAGVFSYALEQGVPAGLTISNISESGEYDPEGAVIRWGPFQDNLTRNLSFSATAGAGGPTTLTFTGLASFDGASIPVVGPAMVPAAVRLRDLSRLPNGYFVVSVGAADGRPYTIETSTDLQRWVPLTVLANANGVLQFTDPDSVQLPQKFYRILSPAGE
jgi:hypothetical protein